MTTTTQTKTAARRNIGFPPDLHARLKVLAARKGKPLEAEARIAIERHLKREEPKAS